MSRRESVTEIISCDRCEKVVKPYQPYRDKGWGAIFAACDEGKSVPGITNTYPPFIGRRLDDPFRDVIQADLCPSCVASLKAWWKKEGAE